MNARGVMASATRRGNRRQHAGRSVRRAPASIVHALHAEGRGKGRAASRRRPLPAQAGAAVL